MTSDSPSDKAIKRSAEDTSFTPTRKATLLLEEGSDLFEAILYRIEDTYNYTVLDWSRVKMVKYEGRDDVLINIYEDVEPPDGITPIFTESRIRSYRARLSGDDDATPDAQVLSVETT